MKNLTPARKLYSCPNCAAEQMLPVVAAGAHMHQCAGLSGLTAPLIASELDVKVETVERGDFVGAEHGITYDTEGRPVQSVVTTHADGSNDTAVFAPTATASSNL